MKTARRDFMAAAVSSMALAAAKAEAGQAAVSQDEHAAHQHAAHEHPKPARPEIPRLPALLCRTTATVGIDAAYKMLAAGEDTLSAALYITRAQEDDPNDTTAGVGGLPNQHGDVELDACCFHGPSGRAAAVAGVRSFRNPSLLARALMDHTGYSLLIGEGAGDFALAQKFRKESLLTDRAKKTWSVWKQIAALPQPVTNSIFDAHWPSDSRTSHVLPRSQEQLDLLIRRFEPLAKDAGLDAQRTWRAAFDALFPIARPLYVSAVNAKQEISCAATTSGLPWRMPGVAGDVPVIGAGCYLDSEVGSAGASGNAEANIRISGARLVVEAMRRGLSPRDAGMHALKRLVDAYKGDTDQLRFVDMLYYVLRKDGAYSCVSLWHGDRTGHVQQFTVHDGVRRTEECAFLLEGSPANGIQTPSASG